MNCDELTDLLHGYLDEELDLVRNLEIERHLEGCPACAQALARHQRLREALRQPALYQRAGAPLRQRILAALPEQQATAPAPRARARHSRLPVTALAIAASLALFALLTWSMVRLPSAAGEEFLVREVVTAHVRSQLLNRPPDVESPDTHKVKPWFQGKVDFAPPVRDLAAEGYPLMGGRLDYLDGRNVVALVYQRRKHVINLFLWPAPGDHDEPTRALTRQGYHLLTWAHGGFTYWAISDLNAQELLAFADLINR